MSRALRRRCPRCGHARIFKGWFGLVDHCPGCGMKFERESGYWVGAVSLNTALGIAVFFISFGAFLFVTWPDVPWSWVAPVTGGLAVLTVVLAYPMVKLLWVAYDLSVHPLEAHEIEAAQKRVSD